VIGAFIITLLPELLRSFADYRAVANGLILVLIVLFLPKGLWNPAWLRRRVGLRKKGVTP
jgi:branched-chain amino acid transport system permease protein